MAMTSRLFWGIILTIILYASTGASKEEPVVIVLHVAKVGIVLQLQAELESVGYQPVMLEYPAKSLTPLETDKILSEHGAIALINVTSKDDGVEVWVSRASVGGGKLVETIGAEDDSISVATILKSVESLRASLMQFDTLKFHADNTQAKVESRKVEETGSETESAWKKSLSLEIGGRAGHSLGQFSPSVQVEVAVVWWLLERFALYGAPLFPVYPMKTDNDQGKVSVWSGALIVGVREYLTKEEQRFRPWLGIGVGPSLLRIVGDAGPEWKSSRDTLVTAVLAAQAGLWVSLTKRIGLQLSVYSSFSMFWRPVVVIGEEHIAVESPVLIGGSLDMTVRLF